jgi:hypothetical protein
VRTSQIPSRANAFENNTLRSVVAIQKAYNRFKLYVNKDKPRTGSGPINMFAEPSLARILPVHRQLIFSNTDVRISKLEIRNNSYVVFFLLGDSPASEFYVPMFRNIMFRRRGISQKNVYNIQNKANV